jgi:CRP-like cAMP-binding protein
MGATRVGEVDRQAVDALMERHADFHAALLDWQSMRLGSVFRLLEDHATQGLRARMARQLHRLARDHGIPNAHGEVKLALSLVQTDLAGLVGCSRQRANGHLVELVRNQVIRHEAGEYVVTDMNALVQLCEMPALQVEVE